MTLHAYEVVGEALFRESGNRSVPMPCMVVRTQGSVLREYEGTTCLVQVADIQSGFTQLVMPQWFTDWDSMEDDIHLDTMAIIWKGRFFEVAIEMDSYQKLIAGERILSGTRHIVAIKVDGLWVPPDHDQSEQQHRLGSTFTPPFYH